METIAYNHAFLLSLGELGTEEPSVTSVIVAGELEGLGKLFVTCAVREELDQHGVK